MKYKVVKFDGMETRSQGQLLEGLLNATAAEGWRLRLIYNQPEMSPAYAVFEKDPAST